MIRYFDASALVKLYVREARSTAVKLLFADSSPAASRLSEAEISSALARRRRDGEVGQKAHDSALAMMRADMTRMHVVELAPPVVAAIHPLLARHPLRAGDALQLAAALKLRDVVGFELDFVCFDERLNEAARAEGLRIVT